MTLVAILLGTLAAGIGSVWIAAVLSFGMLARFTQHMLSLAAGALLATAFMHLLPEAFEGQVDASSLFTGLLVGLVFFFLLDKAELWHHGHEHHHAETSGEGHDHTHAHAHAHPHPHPHPHAHGHTPGDRHGHGDAPQRGGGSWAVLAGDSVHCFGDGVLIASAFVADMRLGLAASLAVLAHEVPHHMGDLMVLRAGANNRRAALVKVSLAGALTAIGGLAGYWLVDQLYAYLPFFLVAASSSFVYVALADLIPQLQKRLSARETAVQVSWLLAGIVAVSLVGGLVPHAH